jgi:hypothetical protein
MSFVGRESLWHKVKLLSHEPSDGRCFQWSCDLPIDGLSEDLAGGKGERELGIKWVGRFVSCAKRAGEKNSFTAVEGGT